MLRGSSCQVDTDEVSIGPDAASLRKNDEEMLVSHSAPVCRRRDKTRPTFKTVSAWMRQPASDCSMAK
jgi:hypothetical protein